MTKEFIAAEMRALQDRICQGLEHLDGQSNFIEDKWTRSEGGGGRTRVIKDGDLLEKGGVNFSEVHGKVTEMMRRNTEITADEFFATGVSIVLHPNNPQVPIIHMNVRYFELSDGQYWFGGGIDLTPHYIIPERAKRFHRRLKEICDRYHPDFYEKFKAWADDYFFLPHRNETRGIGGIFFDHQMENDDLSKEQLFKFCIELGDTFVSIYSDQVEDRNSDFTDEHKQWMNLRRGRYVEFNLVHDRGTKFGLVSGGRTESILMSLPANASWEYSKEIEKNSAEEMTQNLLRKGFNWLEN